MQKMARSSDKVTRAILWSLSSFQERITYLHGFYLTYCLHWGFLPLTAMIFLEQCCRSKSILWKTGPPLKIILCKKCNSKLQVFIGFEKWHYCLTFFILVEMWRKQIYWRVFPVPKHRKAVHIAENMLKRSITCVTLRVNMIFTTSYLRVTHW